MDDVRRGGCNCGAVRLEARGKPLRVGLCHCLTCRKQTGSAFMAYAVWDTGQVTVTGDTRSWGETTDDRNFCPKCGSGVFAAEEGNAEIEVRLGCLDEAPTDLTPSYELWVPRREHWQAAVAGSVQHTGNRPPDKA